MPVGCCLLLLLLPLASQPCHRVSPPHTSRGDTGPQGAKELVVEEEVLEKNEMVEDDLEEEEEESVRPQEEAADSVPPMCPLGEAGGGERRLPAAIVIGARKGGTRALLEFLALHPQVSLESYNNTSLDLQSLHHHSTLRSTPLHHLLCLYRQTAGDLGLDLYRGHINCQHLS